MSYPIPDKIPCRDNGQPLYKFPKKGAVDASDTYDLWPVVYARGFVSPQAPVPNVIWQDNSPWYGELEFVELYSTGGSGDPYKITCVLQHVTCGHFYALPYEHFLTVMNERGFKVNNGKGRCQGFWQFERRGPYCTLIPVD